MFTELPEFAEIVLFAFHANKRPGQRTYRVFIKYCVFFPRILESLPPLPRQHSADAIGCTKNYQPIGMTVHLHSVESFEGLLQRCRREGVVAVNCEKTQ